MLFNTYDSVCTLGQICPWNCQMWWKAFQLKIFNLWLLQQLGESFCICSKKLQSFLQNNLAQPFYLLIWSPQFRETAVTDISRFSFHKQTNTLLPIVPTYFPSSHLRSFASFYVKFDRLWFVHCNYYFTNGIQTGDLCFRVLLLLQLRHSDYAIELILMPTIGTSLRTLKNDHELMSQINLRVTKLHYLCWN